VKKSEWSDKQLEELLREMPRIQDHRNPRDIYQNLSLKKRKRPAWIIPGLAAAAALFLFFLLVPKLFDGTQYSLDSAKQEESSREEKISISEDNSSDLRRKDDLEQNETGISDAEPNVLMTHSNKTAVFEEDAGTGTVFTYWIPDSQIQFLVPVSIIVTPDNNKDWLTNYTKSMELLHEAEWGLTDYYPLNAKLEMDNNSTVIVDVPNDHKYGQGSASETMFIDSLKKNIAANSQVNKIVFTTNGQPGIELGNYGIIEEIEVNREGKHAFFLYTPDGLDTTYLVPSTETYPDINAALEAMKTDQQVQGLAASLVSGFPLKDFSIEDNKLIITMDENTTMENNQAAVYAYEAILLTAKEFGIETITVLNAPIKFLGPFDLTKEMKVPLAPNHHPIQ